MERHIVQTADGSDSIYVPALQEHYHSSHGAIQESRHVFLQAGLAPTAERLQTIHILEIGFGTGLNALLTAQAAKALGCDIHYEAVEAFPVTAEEAALLNYPAQVGEDSQPIWEAIHSAGWNSWVQVSPHFHLHKIQGKIEAIQADSAFDLIYFDAFSPDKQPELWTVDIFRNMLQALRAEGILVTYCAKGSVRRAMIEAGFVVEKLQGPPGKREMLRGKRPSA